LRYFNVYGRRQSLAGAYALVVGIFFRQRLAGQPMTIAGTGKNRRDFTNVNDVVRANILAAQSKKVGWGEVINIGRGHNYSVNELAKIIGGPTIKIPPRLEPKETLADNSLAKKLLGWQPKVQLPDWIAQYKKEIGLN
jgi:UDP-glucose 4-epimerase